MAKEPCGGTENAAHALQALIPFYRGMKIRTQNYPGDRTRSWDFDRSVHGKLCEEQIAGEFTALPEDVDEDSPLGVMITRLLGCGGIAPFMIFRPDGITLSVVEGTTLDQMMGTILRIIEDAIGPIETVEELPMIHADSVHKAW